MRRDLIKHVDETHMRSIQKGGAAESENVRALKDCDELPAVEPSDMFQVQELVDDIGDDSDILEAFKSQWNHIRTHYEVSARSKYKYRKAYIVRQTGPSADYIASILRCIHSKQKTAYKFNIQFSFLMRNIDTSEVM